MINSVKLNQLFFNWVTLVYALYLFFDKGISYSFLAEITVVAAILIVVRYRDKIVIIWNKQVIIYFILLAINFFWLLRGIIYFDAIDTIRDSFIFNYSFFLLIPFLFNEYSDLFLKRIFILYSWFPLVITVTFLIIVFFPAVNDFSLFGRIPLLEYRKGNMAFHLLISALLMISGKIKISKPWFFLNAFLIGYMFLVVSTFNRGGMIAFLCGFFLFLTLTWKEKFFLNLKQYFKVFPLFFFLILSIYSVTKIEDTIQGRNPGLKQLERNVISLVDRSIEGSLSDNIFWRLNWWGKIVNYTFAGPYFWFGKGLGINLALDDNISMDDTSDRAPLRAPHNFHLHILARYGVPVFILWLYFVFCLFKDLLLKYLGVDSVIFACVILCGLINASFDVALEGPMAAFPFWIWVGLSLARQQMPLPSPQDRS